MSMRTARELLVASYGSDVFPKAGLWFDTSGNPALYDASGTMQLSTSATGAATTRGGIVGGTALKIGGAASVLSAIGAVVSNTTSETVGASATIPANTIIAGTVIKIRAFVLATATNSTDTLLAKLRIGPTTLTGTAVVTGAAVDVANNSFLLVDFYFSGLAAAGATAACTGAGWLSNFGTSSTGVAPVPQALGSTNFATNGALLVELTLTWSVASLSNSAQVNQFIVEVIPA